MRPLLLLIGAGRREFREYLLSSIRQQYRIHLFTASKPTWELEYLDGHTVLDAHDVQAMVTVAREMQDSEPISGVLCWEEARVLPAGEVARALGLPGDPDAVARCAETHLTRQALAAAGVPQPRWARAATLPDALVEAGRIGYPVKAGEAKVETAEQLATLFDTNGNSSILLEEFAAGEEITVDVAVHSGEIFPLCLARKEIRFEHYVHAEDPLLHDPVLFRLLHDTHRALGFYDSVTHTEIMMAPEGPKVMAVNGRLGGDVIPYLGLKATGVDAGLAAAAVARGRAPHVERDRKLVAAVRFFAGNAPVRFDGKGLPGAIDRLEVLPGADLKGRIAFATAVAATAEECKAALDAAEAALRTND
ncbi:MAG TPA: hypothetical protein VFC19_30530 [Candidatus Limnocylindrales bacterium]|nr:hypothetical protein [Candidatus Limnocylindrales bacterium]